MVSPRVAAMPLLWFGLCHLLHKLRQDSEYGVVRRGGEAFSYTGSATHVIESHLFLQRGLVVVDSGS